MSATQEQMLNKRRLRQAVAHANEQAAHDLAEILNFTPATKPLACHGCGKPLTPRAYQGGMPQKWCGDACRQRIAVRGIPAGGFVSALLGDPCVYCGEAGGTLDHIDPSSGGGRNEWANLTGACAYCNSQKGRTSLLQHLLARPLYAELERVKSDLAALKAA